MNQIELERFAYAFEQELSERCFNDVHVRIDRDILYNDLVLQIRGSMFGMDTDSYEYFVPRTWFEHLKQDNKIIRKIFGKPNMKHIKVKVRVLLDPMSKRFDSKRSSAQIVPVMYDNWFMDSPPESIEYNKMMFYPTFYEKEIK